jgi:hypothetical protein
MTQLEYSFEMPTSFSHVEIVTEGDQTFEYTAEAHELHFDGADDIRGGIYLAKEQVIASPRQVTRIRLRRHWWPFEKISESVMDVKRKPIWEARTEFDADYYVSRGESTAKDSFFGYRSEIKGIAANQGIALTDELLDRVFGPIDVKIWELYCKVKQLAGKRPSSPEEISHPLRAIQGRRPA